MSRFLPSASVVVAALVLLLPVGAFAVGAGALLGAFAGYGVGLGALAGAVAASLSLATSMRLLLAVLMGAAAVAGHLAVDRPAMIVGLVVVASLAQASANQVSSGVGVMLPVLVMMNARAGLPAESAVLAVTVIAGFLITQLIARIGGSQTEPRPVPRCVAWRHAVALAITAGVGAVIALGAGLPHGYWLILTISFVLRPEPNETSVVAVERSIGTLAGVVVAVAAAIVTTTPAALMIGAVALVVSTSFGLQRDLRMQHTFLTVAIVLLGSSGLLLAGAELAAERLLLTAVGGLFAVAAALVLQR